MNNLKYKCNAIIGDPHYNGKKCNKIAKWKIKLKKEENYIHLRCGIHAKNKDKIYINNKEKKLKKDKGNEQNDINISKLIKYIESRQYKKDIPSNVSVLFYEFDNLNSDIEIMFKKCSWI